MSTPVSPRHHKAREHSEARLDQDTAHRFTWKTRGKELNET